MAIKVVPCNSMKHTNKDIFVISSFFPNI
uniref:Uncharacterized protein n=1 Tax=Solanum lycopersicum TaxID=4081 RepID=K4C5H1_SOLLC